MKREHSSPEHNYEKRTAGNFGYPVSFAPKLLVELLIILFRESLKNSLFKKVPIIYDVLKIITIFHVNFGRI